MIFRGDWSTEFEGGLRHVQAWELDHINSVKGVNSGLSGVDASSSSRWAVLFVSFSDEGIESLIVVS